MVTLNILSKYSGEIKKFFINHHAAESNIDDDVVEWIYIYRDMEQANEIIRQIIRYAGEYKISAWVKHGDGDLKQII